MHTSFGKYHLSTQIGRKSLRDVYIAYPVSEPEHEVVLKVFDASCLPPHSNSKDLVKKANLIKQLDHQYIAPVLAIGIEEGELYVVSEYLPYGSLRSRMEGLPSKRMEFSDVVKICLQIGQALSYAHQLNIIHGNIKPDNILFDANGNALLTDFSLVGLIDINRLDYKSDPRSIGYLAPEQFIGKVSEKSDQYALACMIYELLTGQVPFSDRGFSLKHSTDAPRVPSHVVDNLPKPIEVALPKALANNPAERYDDVASFIEPFRSLSLPPRSRAPLFPFAHMTSSESSGFSLDETSVVNRSGKPLSGLPVIPLGTDEEYEDAFADAAEDEDPYVMRSLEEEEDEQNPYAVRSLEEDEENPYAVRSLEEDEDPYVVRSLEGEEDEQDPYAVRSLEEDEEGDPYVVRSQREDETKGKFQAVLLEDEETEEVYPKGARDDDDVYVEEVEDNSEYIDEIDEDDEYIDELDENDENDEELTKDNNYIDVSNHEENRKDKEWYIEDLLGEKGAEDPYMDGSIIEEDNAENSHLKGTTLNNKRESNFLLDPVVDEEEEEQFLDAYEEDPTVRSTNFASSSNSPSFPFGAGSHSTRHTTLVKKPEDQVIYIPNADEEDQFISQILGVEDAEDFLSDIDEDDALEEPENLALPPGKPSFPFGSGSHMAHRMGAFKPRSIQRSLQLSSQLEEDEEEDDDTGLNAVGVVEPPDQQQTSLKGEKIAAPNLDEPAPIPVPPPLPRRPRSKKGPILLLTVILIFTTGVVCTRFNPGTTHTTPNTPTSQLTQQPTPQSTETPTLPSLTATSQGTVTETATETGQGAATQTATQTGQGTATQTATATTQGAATQTATATTQGAATQTEMPLPSPTVANKPLPTVGEAPTVEKVPTVEPTPTPIPVVPTPTPKPVPQVRLTYGYQQFNRYTNLTAEGTLDWMQWGSNNATDVNRKAGVSPQISNFTLQGNGKMVSDHVNPTNFTWSDGTPVKSLEKSGGAVSVAGLNNGFRLTVLATTTTRTLKLYVGAYLARGLLSISLNGITHRDGSLDMTHDPKKFADNAVYTIKFSSNIPDQQLIINFTEMNSNGNAGYILLEAATLQ